MGGGGGGLRNGAGEEKAICPEKDDSVSGKAENGPIFHHRPRSLFLLVGNARHCTAAGGVRVGGGLPNQQRRVHSGLHTTKLQPYLEFPSGSALLSPLVLLFLLRPVFVQAGMSNMVMLPS